jgi:hypothetical protein
MLEAQQANSEEKTIESHQGEKVDYDLLGAIPPNFGAKFSSSKVRAWKTRCDSSKRIISP